MLELLLCKMWSSQRARRRCNTVSKLVFYAQSTGEVISGRVQHRFVTEAVHAEEGSTLTLQLKT